MPAYTTRFDNRECITCTAKATVLVSNTYNASCGFYCASCGNKRVKELDAILGGGKGGVVTHSP